MTTITVDARGCGAGKTRNYNIPLIQNYIEQKKGVLVVVPSIILQQQYSNELDQRKIPHKIINCKMMLSENSVADQLRHELINNPQSVVIVTHQGFIGSVIPFNECRNRLLIVDEALDCFSMEYITLNVDQKQNQLCDDDQIGLCLKDDQDDDDDELVTTKTKNYFKFQNVFEWDNPTVSQLTSRPQATTQPYFELKIKKGSSPSLLATSPQWRRIANPNVKLWTTWHYGDVLINNSGTVSRLMLDLNPFVVYGWDHVHISAAAFEKTSMGV